MSPFTLSVGKRAIIAYLSDVVSSRPERVVLTIEHNWWTRAFGVSRPKSTYGAIALQETDYQVSPSTPLLSTAIDENGWVCGTAGLWLVLLLHLLLTLINKTCLNTAITAYWFCTTHMTLTLQVAYILVKVQAEIV